VYQYGQSQGTGNILKEDPNWTVEAINEAMKGEKQTIHILTNEIPVHILFYCFGLTILERSIF
jgi:murein L,D-transpeptidase YcbB/YkuD